VGALSSHPDKVKPDTIKLDTKQSIFSTKKRSFSVINPTTQYDVSSQ
jgi:hypothetical protein